MHLCTILHEGTAHPAIKLKDRAVLVSSIAPELPRDWRAILAQHEKTSLTDIEAALLRSTKHISIEEDNITYLPPLTFPHKIICVGLNYTDHVAETKRDTPEYPVLFLRLPSTLTGHNAPLIRPLCSTKCDYEGELVAVIGARGRHVPKEKALSLVAGYSIFNDMTIRDYQSRTPQWTLGKNFDHSGGFGPVIVTANHLPDGAKGLRLTTQVNGETLQDDTTDHMLFDVATLISTITEVMTLEPGDIIVTGTPSGVGFARRPPLYLKDGDRCDITIEGIGTLTNSVKDERAL